MKYTEDPYQALEVRGESRELKRYERREIARPRAHSRAQTMQALNWAFAQGGRDGIEALLGGEMRPRQLRTAPRSARRMNAEGQRIAERIRRFRTSRPRGAGRPAGRPRAAATRSSVRSGDSGSDDPDGEPPAAERWRWTQPVGGWSA